MKVSTLYTPGALDASVSESLVEVALRMRENDVSALAVLSEDEELVGIITERDLVQAVADGSSPRLRTVADYMSTDPITAAPDDDVVDVAMRMMDNGVRHLPVVQAGAIIGMISVRDLLMLEAWPAGVKP